MVPTSQPTPIRSAEADADDYYVVLDRNRNLLGRFGDDGDEISATREWVASYFAIRQMTT